MCTCVVQDCRRQHGSSLTIQAFYRGSKVRKKQVSGISDLDTSGGCNFHIDGCSDMMERGFIDVRFPFSV